MRYQELLRREALEAHAASIPALPSTAARQASMLWPLAGSWIGSERHSCSPWSVAGIARGVATMRVDFGGRVLVHTHRLERPDRCADIAYAVMAVGAAQRQVDVFWFDAFDLRPVVASGLWTGDCLSFLRSTPSGPLRYTYTLFGGDSYILVLEGSLDGGHTWSFVSEGSYIRAGS